jgi:uncharacterized protein (TIGR02145 family)
MSGCHVFEDDTDKPIEIKEGEPIQTENQEMIFSIFEIVTVDLGNQTFTNGRIKGKTLEGEFLDLLIEGNSLTFMVPKLNEGSYKLVFLEKNKPFNISFEVKPHILKEQPAKYLEKYLQKTQEQIASLEKMESLLSEAKNSELKKDLVILKKSLEDQFAKAALLNDSDLAEMAYFFEANEDRIEELLGPVRELDGSSPGGRTQVDEIENIEDTGKKIMLKFPSEVIKVVKEIPKFAPIVSMGFLNGVFVSEIESSSGAAVGLGLTIGGILLDFNKLFAKIEARSDLVRTIGDATLKSNLRADFLFENEKTHEIIVSMNYRTLFNQDENSSNSFIRDYLASFKTFLGAWENLNSKIPLGLKFSPASPTSLSTSNSKLFRVHSDYLSFSEISNPKVTGELKKENGKLYLTFNTSEEDAQEFDFKINYENQDFGKLASVLNAAVINLGCNVKLELTEYNVLTATATGYGPFKFQWSTGLSETAPKFHKTNVLWPGNYSVTVTDQNDCVSQATINVPCKLKIGISQSGKNVDIQILDGPPPFYFSWSNGSTQQSQINLPNGVYNVTVQDGMGCIVKESIRVGEDPEFDLFVDPRDGNEYKTIKIGNQTWFAENLRFAGDIRHVTSVGEWETLFRDNYASYSHPAWAYYDFNSSYDKVHGKLYNWFAVHTGKLCPNGWHIPSDEDWKTLSNFLGGNEVAGGKMKSFTDWSFPNFGATNESGFSALASGILEYLSSSTTMGKYAFFWSSTEDSSDWRKWVSWSYFLTSTDGRLYRASNGRTGAFSCRCLKN